MVRKSLVRVAGKHSAEAPGRTCQHSCGRQVETEVFQPRVVLLPLEIDHLCGKPAAAPAPASSPAHAPPALGQAQPRATSSLCLSASATWQTPHRPHSPRADGHRVAMLVRLVAGHAAGAILARAAPHEPWRSMGVACSRTNRLLETSFSQFETVAQSAPNPASRIAFPCCTAHGNPCHIPTDTKPSSLQPWSTLTDWPAARPPHGLTWPRRRHPGPTATHWQRATSCTCSPPSPQVPQRVCFVLRRPWGQTIGLRPVIHRVFWSRRPRVLVFFLRAPTPRFLRDK